MKVERAVRPDYDIESPRVLLDRIFDYLDYLATVIEEDGDVEFSPEHPRTWDALPWEK